MLLNYIYKIGLELEEEELSENITQILWLVSDIKTMIPSNKAEIKKEINGVISKWGIEFIDFFVYTDSNDENQRVCEVIFNINNYCPQKKVILMKVFVSFFGTTMLLPKQIKILEAKVAEKNIPLLFGVL